MNTQTITIVDDGGVVMVFATVPDIGMHWGDMMFTELKERHGGISQACCLSILTVAVENTVGEMEQNSTHFGMWKTLDVMHCISRMISQCNS